jgi:hypothetical protein
MTTTDTSGQTAKDTAKETAGTAADEGKHVAGVAQDEATNLASEAATHAKNLWGEAASQVDDQSRLQRDRLVGTLRTFGDDLDSMAQRGDHGLAADLARQVADRAHDLSGRLDGREPRELLDDLRGFARRKPGTFLLGALAAGVVVGRLTRGARAAAGTGGASAPVATQTGASVGTAPHVADVTSPADPPPPSDDLGTAAGDPLAGVPRPTEPVASPGTSVAADTDWSDVRGARP